MSFQSSPPVSRSQSLPPPPQEKERSHFPRSPQREKPSDMDQMNASCCCNPVVQFFSFLRENLLRLLRFLGCCHSESRSSTQEPDPMPPEQTFQNDIPEGALMQVREKHTVLTQSAKDAPRLAFPIAGTFQQFLYSQFSYEERSPIPTYPEGILEKYSKNAEKAFTEHAASEADVYHNPGPVTLETLGGTLLPLEGTKNPKYSLKFGVADAPGHGKKPSEDAHLYVDATATHGVAIAAVFDGHGGTWVSQFAADCFDQIFFDNLTVCNYIVPLALELSLATLQERLCLEIESNRQPKAGGSTGLICCIDRINNLVYTATLGDSEANLYRRIEEGGNIVSIPLSCVRNWTSKTDEARAYAFYEKFYPEAVQKGTPLFIEGKDSAKERKIPGRSDLECFKLGPNVSRALGDVLFTQIVDGRSIGITQKPKITVQALERDDCLVLACDGLKDFVTERAIANKISELPDDSSSEELAQALVQSSLDNQSPGHGDNVTVLVIDVDDMPQKSENLF